MLIVIVAYPTGLHTRFILIDGYVILGAAWLTGGGVSQRTVAQGHLSDADHGRGGDGVLQHGPRLRRRHGGRSAHGGESLH